MNCFKTLLEFCNNLKQLVLILYFTDTPESFPLPFKIVFCEVGHTSCLSLAIKNYHGLKSNLFLVSSVLSYQLFYSPFLLICALSVPCYFHCSPQGSLQFVFALNSWQNKHHLLAGNSPVPNTVTVCFPVQFTLIPPRIHGTTILHKVCNSFLHDVTYCEIQIMQIFYLHPLGSITSWNTDPITNTCSYFFLWPGADSTSDAYSTIKTKYHHAARTWSDPTNQKGLWIAINI